MPSNSIKVKPTLSTNIVVDEPNKIGLKTTNIVLDKVPSRVTAHPRSYTLVGNDVYVIKHNSDPEPWFQDMLNDSINNGDLADEVSDLDNRFTNFEEGVTLEIGYLKDSDNAMAYSIETLKTSNINNTSAIQNLDVVKTSEDEARAISRTTIASWQNNGEGSAWFDSQVSTISNVAYSAAKSASTLTASINSQQGQLNAIVGDIDTLQSQVDGKVETWFGEDNPVLGDGTLNPDIEPYKTWLNDNDVARHTGDTYVYFEYDTNGNKKILVTFRFGQNTDNDNYEWYVFEDDLASEAYQRALEAQETADGKITTYYQTYPPTTAENPEIASGDLWLDSDDNNKMYRFQGTPLTWVFVTDKRIEATINKLDEVSVDVDGTARAKSSLSVDANGVIGGYVAESDGSTSRFRIFADKFSITNHENGSDAGAPFSVDTTTNQIKFNGTVSFENIEGSEDLATMQDLRGENGTVISGGAIYTNSLRADRLVGDTVWVNGALRSSNYNLSKPYTSGFKLQSNARGSYDDPNIYGAYIRGGTIEAATIKSANLISSKISVRDLVVLTDAGYETGSVISSEISGYDLLDANGIGNTLEYTIKPYNANDNVHKMVATKNETLSVFHGASSAQSFGFTSQGIINVPGIVLFISHEYNNSQSFATTTIKVYSGSSLLGKGNISYMTSITICGIKFSSTIVENTNNLFASYVVYASPTNIIKNFSGVGNLKIVATTNVGVDYEVMSSTLIVYNI